MGMYPSARLNYGIDLGEISLNEPEDECDSEELHWLTWALWSELWEWDSASSTYLTANGIEGVQLTRYGHPDHSQYALVTKAIGCYGWGDVTEVSTADLAITDDATRLLRAWALLFPDHQPGPIAWRLSADFS